MKPNSAWPDRIDVAMVGTFSAWRLGTLQARALPLAVALRSLGVNCAIVTVPWDQATEQGSADVISGVPLLNSRHASLAATPLAVADQMRLLRTLQPRLVHVFKPKGYGGLSGALSRHRPLLVDSDDWEGDGGWNRLGSYSLVQRRLFQFQERALLRNADGVSAASTLLVKRARALRSNSASTVGGGTVRHIPNGLPRPWFEDLSNARGRHSDVDTVGRGTRKIVLYSRFAEFPDNWLGAFAMALDHRISQPVEIAVLGDAQSHLDYGWRTHVNVNLMGYVARDSIPTHLASSVIAVYPYGDSLVARSKHSVKLLELMAAGCAVVASDTGDIAPVLGPTGVVVRGTDPSTFAETVARLLVSESTLRHMQHAARSRVQTRFTIDRIASGLCEFYSQFVTISRG